VGLDIIRRPASARGVLLLGSRLLEHEPIVVEQPSLEAHAVGADARGERKPKVRAGQPSRNKPKLEQRLLQAWVGEPSSPLTDGLDVVEPAVRARYQPEMGLGGADDLVLTKGEQR